MKRDLSKWIWSLLLATVFLTLGSTPFPVLAQGPCETTVTVTLGDTLTAIARRCNTTVEAFLEANPEIRNPNQISVGQVLAVPGTQTPDLPEIYVVKTGDTLGNKLS